MKHLALFSFFDPNNQIDNYVIYYLKELNKVCDIILSADCHLKEEELCKIRDFTIDIIHQKHGEYDFGSYKRAYQIAERESLLQKYDWLVLANDSCYGPFYSFQTIFDKMESQNIDFWGFSHNTVDKVPHIQSYFVSLNKKCFLSTPFKNFINRIEKQEIRKNVVFKYEHGLTKILSENGFAYNSFFEEKDTEFKHDPAKNWDFMIQQGFPFIKRTLFTRNSYNHKNLNSYQEVIKKYHPKFNIQFIEENLSKYTIKPYENYITRKIKKKKISRFFEKIKQ